MNNKNKWFIVATLLVVIGLVAFSAVMTTLGWDFTKLNTTEFIKNTYTVDDEFFSLSIDVETTDITILPSENGKCIVKCHEEEKVKHNVFVKDNILNIKAENTKKWFDYIGISFGSPKITVYLPDSYYENLNVKVRTGDVSIMSNFDFDSIKITTRTGDITNYSSALDIMLETNTGDVFIEKVSASDIGVSVSTGEVKCNDIDCQGDIFINTSTGDVSLLDITCLNLSTECDTGDILLEDVIANLNMRIVTDTGDISFNVCDASDMYIETDTGDVSGKLLTSKVFYTDTDTGSVNVPDTNNGGLCEIITDTGDINIKVIAE